MLDLPNVYVGFAKCLIVLKSHPSLLALWFTNNPPTKSNMAEPEKNKPVEPPLVRPGVSERDPRVQMAAERTLLAWVRTSLALMAFGFVLARFALILSTLGIEVDTDYANMATGIGVVMVTLGAISSAGAPWHYRSYFARIRSDGSRPFAAWTLAMIVAYATAIIAVALVIFLLLIDVVSPQ